MLLAVRGWLKVRSGRKRTVSYYLWERQEKPLHLYPNLTNQSEHSIQGQNGTYVRGFP